MPLPFFRAIKRPPIKSTEEAEQLINEVKTKLGTYENSNALLNLISQRQLAFYNQLDALVKQEDKQPYIYAYIHFAKHLKEYIDNPQNVDERISQYHSSTHYYNVGGDNNQLSYVFGDEVAHFVLKLSMAFLIASLITLPFNPMAGLIILGVCVALMGPSLFYNLAVTRPNALLVQKEETELFLAAQALLDPQVITNEQAQDFTDLAMQQ